MENWLTKIRDPSIVATFARRILFIAGLVIILEITPCVYLVHTVTVNVPS